MLCQRCVPMQLGPCVNICCKCCPETRDLLMLPVSTQPPPTSVNNVTTTTPPSHHQCCHWVTMTMMMLTTSSSSSRYDAHGQCHGNMTTRTMVAAWWWHHHPAWHPWPIIGQFFCPFSVQLCITGYLSVIFCNQLYRLYRAKGCFSAKHPHSPLLSWPKFCCSQMLVTSTLPSLLPPLQAMEITTTTLY